MNHVHPTDEYLDLVDENDVVIGRKLRADVRAENLSNFRVVNLFIRNSLGELWIPRRSAHKRDRPLALDMSMGGHVDSGETYEEALKRETMEELNINLDVTPALYLGYLVPHRDQVGAFMKVYELSMDEVPNYNKNDFIEYFWLTPEELLERIKEGVSAKYDLPIVVKRFYIR
ncbi:MAG: NUDIX hydrolase [Patescibacteria group bacterium]